MVSSLNRTANGFESVGRRIRKKLAMDPSGLEFLFESDFWRNKEDSLGHVEVCA